MEATAHIQRMREENIDGEEQEEADEEEICEGESQSKVRSEEGSQETGCQEGCQEGRQEGSQETGYKENCQEAHCSSIQGGAEETCGSEKFSRYVQTGGPSSQQETCEAIRG